MHIIEAKDPGSDWFRIGEASNELFATMTIDTDKKLNPGRMFRAKNPQGMIVYML